MEFMNDILPFIFYGDYSFSTVNFLTYFYFKHNCFPPYLKLLSNSSNFLKYSSAFSDLYVLYSFDKAYPFLHKSSAFSGLIFNALL